MFDAEKDGNSSTCLAETTLKAISGRWKILILRELFQGLGDSENYSDRFWGLRKKCSHNN